MPSKKPTYSKSKTTAKRWAVQPKDRALDALAKKISLATTIERARLDPGALSPRDVLQFQGTIGNRATGSLLPITVQRLDEDGLQVSPPSFVQREDGEEGPLDADQVRRAIRFYRRRPTQYTEDIIRQIQAGVGVPETGTVDEAMVQAVARYQQAHPPLAVDGMAGPRTLPALFPSGLAQEAEIEAFAGGARGVIEGDWAAKTVEQRADALIEQVNARLDAANVPRVGRVIQNLGPNTPGRFAFSLWSVRLNPRFLASGTLTDTEAASLASHVYHEARHAEQFYRMAQMLAGEGRTAAQIARQMGIPNRIAVQAAGDPLARGSMEALIADGWFQSIYGTGREHRERVLQPTGSYQEYRNLPEESDAWRVGEALIAAYSR